MATKRSLSLAYKSALPENDYARLLKIPKPATENQYSKSCSVLLQYVGSGDPRMNRSTILTLKYLHNNDPELPGTAIFSATVSQQLKNITLYIDEDADNFYIVTSLYIDLASLEISLLIGETFYTPLLEKFGYTPTSLCRIILDNNGSFGSYSTPSSMTATPYAKILNVKITADFTTLNTVLQASNIQQIAYTSNVLYDITIRSNILGDDAPDIIIKSLGKEDETNITLFAYIIQNTSEIIEIDFYIQIGGNSNKINLNWLTGSEVNSRYVNGFRDAVLSLISELPIDTSINESATEASIYKVLDRSVKRTLVSAASYSASVDDCLIAVSQGTQNGSVILPDPATYQDNSKSERRYFIIHDLNSNASFYPITITAINATINGRANYVLSKKGGAIWLYTEGNNYYTYSESGFNTGGTRMIGTANYSIDSFDDNLQCQSRTANIILTLPQSPIINKDYIFKDAGGNAAVRTITIVPYATTGQGSTIDGNPNYVIDSNFGEVCLIYNGKWFVKQAFQGQNRVYPIITATQAVINTKYITNSSSLVIITLPLIAVIGDQFSVRGLGIGLWRISQNDSDVIHGASSSTTSGSTGFLLAAAQYDSVTLEKIAVNEWEIVGGLGMYSYH